MKVLEGFCLYFKGLQGGKGDGGYLLLARSPPLLKWGINCVPQALDNKKRIDIIKSVENKKGLIINEIGQ